jgi:flagellar biosynthesis/type III secretory pathway M-ring protein FliF/YscJ
MGFDEKRGDSVNVVNSAFLEDSTVIPDVPWWRTPDMIALREAAREVRWDRRRSPVPVLQ